MTETDSLSRAQKAVTYNDVPALTSSIDIMVAVLLNDWGAVRNPKSEQPVFFANQSGLLGPITKYAVELAKDDFHLLHAISALRAVIRMAVDGSPESNTALDHCLTLIKRHPQPDVRVAVLENAARDVEDRESEQKILEALLIEVTELHLAKLHSFDARLQAMVFVGDRGLNTLAHTETALTSAVTLLETADPNVKTAEAAFLITDLASRKFPGTPRR